MTHRSFIILCFLGIVKLNGWKNLTSEEQADVRCPTACIFEDHPSFQVEGEVAPVDIYALAQYSTLTLNLLLRSLQGERDQ